MDRCGLDARLGDVQSCRMRREWSRYTSWLDWTGKRVWGRAGWGIDRAVRGMGGSGRVGSGAGPMSMSMCGGCAVDPEGDATSIGLFFVLERTRGNDKKERERERWMVESEQDASRGGAGTVRGSFAQSSSRDAKQRAGRGGATEGLELGAGLYSEWEAGERVSGSKAEEQRSSRR